MSLRAQKLRSSIDRSMGQVEAIAMICDQYASLMIVHNCSAVFFFLMAAILCIAFGDDTGPKSRVNFSAGSKRAQN